MAYEAPTIRLLGSVAELTLDDHSGGPLPTLPLGSLAFDPSVF